MRTWRFDDFRPPPSGAWDDEPDKAHWIDPATDLDCMIRRSLRGGALCGYVGVPTGHPWHGQYYAALALVAAHLAFGGGWSSWRRGPS